MTATRLTLICHASTAATEAARFPAGEGIADRGRNEIARAPRIGPVRVAWTSPALSAWQTAEALGLTALADVRIGDLDWGRWAGLSPAEIERREPQAWPLLLADPAARPHGGESLEALLRRVGAWLAQIEPDLPRVAAVTHAAVIRAAILHVLGAAPLAFWRIDVAPLTVVDLRGRGGQWTLRALTPLAKTSARRAPSDPARPEPVEARSAGPRRPPVAPPGSDTGG